MKNKKLISLCCVMVLLFVFSVPASANSAAPYWEGTAANGVIVKEGDIPIEVESELLTFDIPTLPYASYQDVESFLKYDSKVTAEYTFFNPTDMTVKATLLFPFGEQPDYSKLVDSKTGESFVANELERYGVYVNGEKIEAKIRYTNTYYGSSEFNFDEHIAAMSDDFVTDDYYRKGLTVTKYSYEIKGNTQKDARFYIFIDSLGSESRVAINDPWCSAGFTASGGYQISKSFDERNKKLTVSFYVLGEPPAEAPSAGWYKRNHLEPYEKPFEKIDGEYSYLGSEEMTFNDFIFSGYDKQSGISEVDWYNACLSRIKACEDTEGSLTSIGNITFGSFMRWYEYELTFAPGEKIKNTVTAPIYPDIDAFNHVDEYRYTYLLSPASDWAKFGTLDIVVNTPYEMSNANIQGFEKTDSGYKLSREGLPKEAEEYVDLHFTLLNDGNTPLKQPHTNAFVRFLQNAVKTVVSAFLYVLLLIASIVDKIFDAFL